MTTVTVWYIQSTQYRSRHSRIGFEWTMEELRKNGITTGRRPCRWSFADKPFRWQVADAIAMLSSCQQCSRIRILRFFIFKKHDFLRFFHKNDVSKSRKKSIRQGLSL